MWIYCQSNGVLWNPDGTRCAIGYSGYGKHKNNPDSQNMESLGPIPVGLYEIGEPYQSKRVGPFALPLEPIEHDALGRTAFRIHGDSIQNPGKASQGCPIFNRSVREKIHASNDDLFQVIE